MRRGLVLAVVGLTCVLIAAVLALLDPTREQYQVDPSIWPSIFAGAGALLLLAAAWLERGALRGALGARQARFGAFAAAYTLVVLIALAALAFLVERQNWRFDLTHDRRSSLEEDTLRILSSIPKEGERLSIVGFTGGGNLTAIDRASAEAELIPLFDLLERNSPRIETKLTDATRQPALARAMGVSRLPSVAVTWKPPGEDEEARVVRSDVLSEREVARAIEQVLLGESRPAYVLNGHGEISPIDVEGTGGFFQAMMAIAGDNYDVRPLNLIEESAVPEDAALLVIAGPRTDFVQAEVEALDAFARRGGRMLLLLGPAFNAEGRVMDFPVLANWLGSSFGVELGASVICDLEGLSGPSSDLRSLLVPPQPNAKHPIMRGRDRMLVVPWARPIRLAAALPHGIAAETLLSSGPRSWAEADSPGRPVFDPADERGPHGFALALSSKPFDQETAARLVIVGSQSFADNSRISAAGNSSFLLDAAAWLNEREATLEARRERGRDGTAVIPERQGLLILLCAAAIPAVLALSGVLIWWQRRRL